jgi:uncharacterized repeat protein (TIGR01451 family)
MTHADVNKLEELHAYVSPRFAVAFHQAWNRALAVGCVVCAAEHFLTSNPNVWVPAALGETNSSLSSQEPIQAYKTASQWMVASGQVLTYTIHVHNASLADILAQVADPLPHDMNYIPGSANLGADYDPGSNTLMWNTLTVTKGSEVDVSFAVTALL